MGNCGCGREGAPQDSAQLRITRHLGYPGQRTPVALAFHPRPSSPAIYHGTGAAGAGVAPACPPRLARAATPLSRQPHMLMPPSR